MSLFSVINTASTALAAQSLRLNTTASNLANANTTSSSINTTYRSRQPVFAPLFDELSDSGDDAAIGVEVQGIVESQAPLRREYQPGNPMADGDGYVFMSNVNVIEEMANMISASRSYQTNIEIMDASKQMLTRTLAIGQQ
jgi:flagellar basal-body rod protein FlgC